MHIFIFFANNTKRENFFTNVFCLKYIGSNVMKVKDCMCKEVVFVKPDCDTEECAKLMCQNHIGCIPVCDDS